MEIQLKDIFLKDSGEMIKVSKTLCGMEVDIKNTLMDTNTTKTIVDSILSTIYRNTPILFFNKVCKVKIAMFFLKEKIKHTPSGVDYDSSIFKNENCSGIILHNPSSEYKYYLEKAMYLPKKSYVLVTEIE